MDSNPAFDRIYAQLYPESDTLAELLRLQEGLDPQQSGRLVPAKGLHMTIIHFGIINQVWNRLSRAVGTELTRQVYLRQIEKLVSSWEDCLRSVVVGLEPIGFTRFGKHGLVLAVEYRPTYEILELHQQCLARLVTFLQNCRVADPTRFMREDYNFTNALTLRPHISLYKGYSGAEPTAELQNAWLHAAPVTYSGH